eukprot:jgi/Botrbrau1/4669/Bobra.33_2s0036.3
MGVGIISLAGLTPCFPQPLIYFRDSDSEEEEPICPAQQSDFMYDRVNISNNKHVNQPQQATADGSCEGSFSITTREGLHTVKHGNAEECVENAITHEEGRHAANPHGSNGKQALASNSLAHGYKQGERDLAVLPMPMSVPSECIPEAENKENQSALESRVAGAV